MKRRNFLSGLMAAPLALKARLAQFFVRKPVALCGAPMFGTFMLRAILRDPHPGEFPDPFMLKLIRLAREANKHPRVDRKPVHCSLPLGHKGPHALLNPSER